MTGSSGFTLCGLRTATSSSSPKSGFRTYTGIISRPSAVFVKIHEHPSASDALADKLGLVIDADHKMEGRVLVHVSDSARDFGHLRIFYDGLECVHY